MDDYEGGRPLLGAEDCKEHVISALDLGLISDLMTRRNKLKNLENGFRPAIA
jgi:hypothetical protein